MQRCAFDLLASAKEVLRQQWAICTSNLLDREPSWRGVVRRQNAQTAFCRECEKTYYKLKSCNLDGLERTVPSRESLLVKGVATSVDDTVGFNEGCETGQYQGRTSDGTVTKDAIDHVSGCRDAGMFEVMTLANYNNAIISFPIWIASSRGLGCKLSACLRRGKS